MLVRFVELTLPLTIPSLVYFFQVNKDRKEREEKEKQKIEDSKKDEKDKFEKSLPFFYVRDEVIFAQSPQKSPILNVKLRIGSIGDNFNVLREISTTGSIHSEHTISIGGLVDGDEIKTEDVLEKNNLSKNIRWFVVYATTITNDNIYFVYLPYLNIGWHFYEQRKEIVRYIGEDTYCEAARLLAIHISESKDEFSYKAHILNNAVIYLGNNNLQKAFAQLIYLVREVKELKKYEKLYILDNSYLMLHHLDDYQEIELNYFKGNLLGENEFTRKYKKIAEGSSQKISVKEYLYDIIEMIKSDEEVSLNFWLRNVEVYIRDQSSVGNEKALLGELKQIIPHLIG